MLHMEVSVQKTGFDPDQPSSKFGVALPKMKEVMFSQRAQIVRSVTLLV
jgi:hypothetical protein